MLDSNYGLLINKDTKLHRQYFDEMPRLIGIKVIYRAPRKDKHFTTYAEIESNYQEPLATYCIFNEHPDQKSLKKMGWVSELQDNASLIHVKYDLPDIQQGALFIVPSGLDNTKGRLFRVTQLSNGMIYPASITCEIVPEYIDTMDNSLSDHEDNSINIISQDNDPNFI